MGSDSEKRSRLNQKYLGVTNRIWIIVFVFLCIIAFTHYALPSQPPPRRVFISTHLEPKNYLNETDHNPFEFCPVFGPGDELAEKYGAIPLSQSRLHLGSGARLHRVIHKALLGQPVVMSVLGGSVSACHGAGDDPLAPNCYPSRFFQWWNTVFPHPASELTNGAMRRTNSGYFGFCSGHHIPDDTDLVVLEFDADDPADPSTLDNFEILVRSVLDRPDQPAVVIMGHFSPQVHQTHGFAGPDHWHSVVAQFYDVPHVSIKPILYPDYMSNPDSIKKYYADAVLANTQGHEVIADVLISYFQSQICSAWATVGGYSHETSPALASDPGADTHLFGGVGVRKGAAVPEPQKPADDAKKQLTPVDSHAMSPQLRIPPNRISTRPKSDRLFREIAPFCASANDLVNPVPPSLFYGSGWYAHHPPAGSSALLTTAHYWHSSLPLSKLRIPVRVGAGDIGIYYLKEPSSEIGEGSYIECWVDDNYSGSKIIENAADINDATPALEIIDHYVSRGPHFVECQLLGEEGQSVPSFKIVGVFST
ncbi:hypothetical protein SERLA73DRAFT_134595 [Serpula lacrymans var. lacrymans S7.3]|uniref:Cap64 protein n=2 Tax=Serpula lacrymans var. lacrymans TaxID=341189 RepID=F8PSE1_SERL3|nr:hypothetical protein SERLA73DRAFT_134595 [Serpula lacrymans var. lacrymans S7.3]